MTPRTEIHNGARYSVRPAPDRPAVFVADQRMRSDAHAARNTGLGIVTAWLDPMMSGAPLAWVRLSDGRAVVRAVATLRPADNVATHRILPGSTRMRSIA